MSTQISVDVGEKAYELGQGLVAFTAAVKTALADGWQPGHDVMAVLQAALADLLPVIRDLSELPAEEQADMKAFVRAIGLSAVDLAFLFVKP